MCKSVHPEKNVHPKADRDEPQSVDERSESAGVGPKAPGGRAKRGRRRRTERTLRTEQHWSFSTPLIELTNSVAKYVVHFAIAIVNESAAIFAICAEMGGLAS